jgi:hypothetical protein
VSELLILIEGALAGQIRADKSGRLSLSYEEAWRAPCANPEGVATSFNKRDCTAAERFWSPRYIQHVLTSSRAVRD